MVELVGLNKQHCSRFQPVGMALHLIIQPAGQAEQQFVMVVVVQLGPGSGQGIAAQGKRPPGGQRKRVGAEMRGLIHGGLFSAQKAMFLPRKTILFPVRILYTLL